jgi:hypothetical protein
VWRPLRQSIRSRAGTTPRTLLPMPRGVLRSALLAGTVTVACCGCCRGRQQGQGPRMERAHRDRHPPVALSVLRRRAFFPLSLALPPAVPRLCCFAAWGTVSLRAALPAIRHTTPHRRETHKRRTQLLDSKGIHMCCKGQGVVVFPACGRRAGPKANNKRAPAAALSRRKSARGNEQQQTTLRVKGMD